MVPQYVAWEEMKDKKKGERKGRGVSILRIKAGSGERRSIEEERAALGDTRMGAWPGCWTLVLAYTFLRLSFHVRPWS